MIKDVSTSAGALYDGGWRASDMEQLIEEYELSESEASQICRELENIEARK